jgi:glycosyltransferase involved in cell wall biosynthesis
VHGFLYDGDFYSRLGGAGLGIPVLNSVRNDRLALNPLQRLGFWLTSRWMHGVVANSYAGARFAQSARRLAESEVHVVWNGIDLHEIQARLETSSAPALQLSPGVGVRRVCVVGSIKPQKDHGLALRVAHELHRRDPLWRFLFVGDASNGGTGHKAEVLAQAKALGTDDYVRFTGIRADAVEIVSSCDVSLVTSHFEGFPNVVLEAMACFTPVASTDYSDVRRILPFAWQVSSSREPAELADIVERCYAERDSVAAAQRRWVEDNATVARAATRLLEVYGNYLTSR